MLQLNQYGGNAERVDQAFKEPARSQRIQRPLPNTVLSQTDTDLKLFDALSSFKIYTNQVSMHLADGWRHRIFALLDDLYEPDSWDTDDKVTEMPAFKTFMKVILELQPTRLPGIGISSAGSLVAAWYLGEDRLTIICDADDKVQFILSASVDGDLESANVKTKASRISESLGPFRPERWLAV
ncbi:hypothetical protein [Mesorhizobium sp. M0910]|uniref:hypothetical protein n=1 Tax=Mesorhizobium sp. M0910 TaxID=2957025 RepID=UPI003337EC6D